MALLRSDPDCSSSLQPFWERLAETIAWCAPRADPSRPKDSLRDPYLAPRPLEPSYFDAVEHVAINRRLKLGSTWPASPSPLGGGRLLIYFPDAELSDGAAEETSAGYFDVFNGPPWDTWVGFFQDRLPRDSSYANYLIAWVPPAFLDTAGAGIDVNPEVCIEWFENADVGLRTLLAVAREPQRGEA